MVLLERGGSLNPENGLSIQISKHVVPNLNSFLSRELPDTLRRLRGEGAERRKCELTTETVTDKHVPRQLGPNPGEEQPELSIQCVFTELHTWSSEVD